MIYERKPVTLGQFLDLIDSNRESEEHINIMEDGEVLVRGMVCYDAWEEDREINSISINEDCEYQVWLEDRKGGDPANKKDQETLDYYVTVCTNCHRLTPIANYCMWCGKKGTSLVGDENGN